jgi:hypothetical protein
MDAWIRDVEVETISKADEERSIAYHECGPVKVVFDWWERVYHGQILATWQAKLAGTDEDETLGMESEIDRLVGAYCQHQEALDCDQVSGSPSSIWHCWQEKDSASASASLAGLVTNRGVGRIDPRLVFEAVTYDGWVLGNEEGRWSAFYRENCQRLCLPKIVASGATDGRHDDSLVVLMQMLLVRDMLNEVDADV